MLAFFSLVDFLQYLVGPTRMETAQANPFIVRAETDEKLRVDLVVEKAL